MIEAMPRLHDNQLSREYSFQCTFRENKDVVAILDRLAKKDGSLFSNWIRIAVRSYLATRGDLTNQERQILGLEPDLIKEARANEAHIRQDGKV